MLIGNYALYGFLITLLWIGTAVFDFLRYTAIFQLKEYRLDRLRDFLRSEQGKNFLKDHRFIWHIFVASILLVEPVPFVALIVLLVDTIYIFIRKKQIGFYRPRLTIKSILILALAFGIEIFLFQLFPLNLPLVLFLRIWTISLAVLFVTLPTQLVKKIFIFRATKKLLTYKNLTVIGITGSYGKSSVKEFTSHLLSTQFRVIKTPKNINSEIGIAKFILQSDFSNVDIFVCEMGAYKIGEIALIARMVKPKVGILTTIGQQHLSLFGTIQNIQSAKYELLRSIPADGLIITNADNTLCTEFLKDLKCQNRETCGFEEKNKPTFQIMHLQTSLKGSHFEAIYQGQRGDIVIPSLGAHQAYNAALAIMVAVNFGIDPNKISEATKKLPEDAQGSLKRYMYGNATIIDDSYNSNPQGFLSALELLSLFPKSKDRIVITRGMLELGDQSEYWHEVIGKEVAKICKDLIIITPDSVEALKRGAGEQFTSHIQTIFDHTGLLQFVQSLKTTDSVILLENRIPQRVRAEIFGEKEH